MGVAPNGYNSVALAELWIPFLKTIEKNSDITLRFATAPDLLEFSQRIDDGDYDLVVTNPYLYTILGQKHTLTNLAELTETEENKQLALVSASHIYDVQQLIGSLIAVKQNEDRFNLQSLDDFLKAKNVSAAQDSLASYDKIIESVNNNKHWAGLVSASKLRSSGKQLNILWQTGNENFYLMSATSSLSEEKLKKLANLLAEMKIVSPSMDTSKRNRISVLSVSKPLLADSETAGSGK